MPLELDEVPFAWMDRALSKYRGVERPDAWVDDARPLISACQDVEGLWVGVWHPNLTAPLGFPGAPAAFARLAQEISAADPYVASLDAIVAWRRARRGIRARQVAPDGRVELAGDTGRAAGRMRLEVPT